jgi:hypothetical protein
MNQQIIDKRQQWRSRLILLLIVALFFSSFGIAALLRFSGWQPEHSKNFGELIKQPINLNGIAFKQQDGSAYLWQPELRRWRIVFVSEQPCLKACQAMLDSLHRVWLSQGRHAEQIDVLWFAEVPDNTYDFKGFIAMQSQPALNRLLPELQSSADYPVYLVNPSGYVIMQYKAGFEPSGFRKDLAKLVK